MEKITVIIIGVLILFIIDGLKIVRPTQKAVIETFGKFSRVADQGLTWIIPFIQQIYYVNTTEQMVDTEEQEIITKDRLNAKVDAQVYFKVRRDDQSVKDSQYNVDDYYAQIIALTKTALRNIIGDLSYDDTNSKRNLINNKIGDVLNKEAKPWGLQIVRAEMKRIEPTGDVQGSMNEVIKAENTKKAAIDLATAQETEADGERRAAIKKANGIAQGKIIVAKGDAERIKLVNESAQKYFVGNAQKLKSLDVTQKSLESNTKVVLTEKGISPQVIIGELPITK